MLSIRYKGLKIAPKLFTEYNISLHFFCPLENEDFRNITSFKINRDCDMTDTRNNKNRGKSSYCNLTTFLHKCLCFLSAIVAIDWQSYTVLYVARVLRDTHCKEPILKIRTKKIPEKELRGQSSSLHILVSVSD
jgi:hypothetical protein